LVARERRLHRDVGNQEMTLIGSALKRLTHRGTRDAVRPARADDDIWMEYLDAAVLVYEFRQNSVRVRFQLRHCNPALD
jgi:hypothetical protein